MKAPRIIISGGGSGGHVFPAIAIADAIRRQVPNAELRFVGASDKIEMEKVPKAGYTIEGLWISGLHRKQPLRNVLFPVKVLASLAKCRGIVRRFRPDVAVGVGGFASWPVLEVASRAGVPVVIQEQNAFAGMANKRLASKVNTVCLGYEAAGKFFPGAKKIVTGNPVREVFQRALPSKAEACAHFGFDPNRPLIFQFGGSLGAASMNRSLAGQVELIRANPEVQILWQVGKLYEDQYQNSVFAQLPNVQMRAFVDRMDLAYAACDLVISRAGALTIAELAATGTPAILIPSPNVAEDHQTSNVKALTAQNAAVLLTDAEAEQQILSKALEVLDDHELRKKLSNSIRAFASLDADDKIASAVLALMN
ncbi:MAG: undecaprenyldiphospho-muramoylpentapeptide beta-N-acetylglucosaminyltransferase [Bacteroidota bacterium]